MARKSDLNKGSKQHVLELVCGSQFETVINGILEEFDIQVATPSVHVPNCTSRSEKRLETYVEKCSDLLSIDDLKGWWIVKGSSGPTWDLLCRIDVDGKPGILLVEAKAHEAELKEQDKKTAVKPGNDDSLRNDKQIRCRIKETNSALYQLGVGRFKLSADHHYQLSNRLAYLNKLAALGIPTVLLYLGWIESPAHTSGQLRNEAHWQRVMGGYIQGVVPQKFPMRRFCSRDGASMQMIIRSALCPKTNHSSGN